MIKNKLFPMLGWWPLVNSRTARADFMAGITGAIIVLPQGVAFAIIAGLPPVYGLYSAIVPTIIAALFGSSRHLISGPTTAISIVIFTTISPLSSPGSVEYIQMVITLTFIAGAFQLALGFARLGTLVNFVSHSVVVGFTAGAAILIGAGQFSNLIGVAGSKRHAFVHVLTDLIQKLPETNFHALAVGIVTLIAALVFKKYLPRWPGMLFAMIIGSLLAVILKGSEHGVRLVGSLPRHLPPFSAPDLSTSAVRALAPAALAVGMLGLAEAVSIARSVATRSHQRIDSNQEFIGQGFSNVVGSFFSSYASSGSFTRTGLNFEAGAITPMSAVYAAAALAVVLVLIAPLTAYLPIASMAGILLLVAYSLIDFHHIKTIIKASKSETAVLTVTFLSTLLVELEFAIYVGVILSLLLYLNRTSHPRFITLAPDPESTRLSFINILKKPFPECPQLKIIRMDGSLFFGAVDHFSEELRNITRQSRKQDHILLLCGSINFIDIAGCEALVDEAHRLQRIGKTLYLCSLKGDVLDVLRRGGFLKRIGEKNIFRSKVEAIEKIVPLLDPERCRICTVRVFTECATMPGTKQGPREKPRLYGLHAEEPPEDDLPEVDEEDEIV